MPRTPDHARRAELLTAAVDYAIENGLSTLTLRPLATALGVQPNTLVHHFGTKGELVGAILNGVRERLRAMRQRMEEGRTVNPLWGVWEWTASREREAFFRFFFEAYGVALRDPDRYATFLERVVSDWIDPQEPAAATLELAVVRGLLLDLLTTGEHDRVESALARFQALRTGSPARAAAETSPRPG